MTAASLPAPNHVTRLLCAGALVDRRFSARVYRELCIPRLRAVAPSPGVDLVLLARHAAVAVEARCEAARALRWLLVPVGLAVALLVVAPALAPLWLGLLVAVGVGAEVVAVRAEADLARQATRLLDRGEVPAGFGAGLVAEAQERRLSEVNAGNVSIYRGTRSGDPFPGLGQRVEAAVLAPIRIDRPRDPDAPIGPVTGSGLLNHIVPGLRRHVERTLVTDSCQVRLVQYVQGTAVGAAAGLLPDRRGAPRSGLPGEIVRELADHPERHVRTYLRAQVVGHSGQIVTTLHAAATVEPHDLVLDVAVHVLRPLHDDHHAADRLPRDPAALTRRLVLRDGPGAALVASPVRARRLAAMRAAGRRPLRMTPEEQAAPGARDLYGAAAGIRERAGLGGRFDFNQRADAARHSHLLVAGLLRELVRYLDGANVDTAELEARRPAIVDRFGDVLAAALDGPFDRLP